MMVATKKNRHGLLLLDKPVGMSSAQLVGKVKYLTKMKTGHGGTLDPLASGLLPVALGEGTKLLPYMLMADKAYECTIRWGEERSTDDAEGEVVAESNARPSQAEIEALFSEFTGQIMQVPPSFSAIKVEGKRAYALARGGEDVQLPEREVVVHDIKLLDVQEHEATLYVHCGKGFYIRSLARDLGRKLGCYGYISMLRRVQVGDFSVKDAFLLEKSGEISDKAALYQAVIPLRHMLDDIPAWCLPPDLVARVRSGNALSLDDEALARAEQAALDDGEPDMPDEDGALVFLQDEHGDMLAIAEQDGAWLKVKRGFNC